MTTFAVEALRKVLKSETTDELRRELRGYDQCAENVSHPEWSRENARILASEIRSELARRFG